jgi:hypothetical protein
MRLAGEGDWRNDPLGGLNELRALQRAVEKGIRRTVRDARKRGYSWSEIGAALDMSKKSARERFSKSGDPSAS